MPPIPQPNKTATKTAFAPATVKLTIGSLDDPKDPELTISAQYNPAELLVGRTIPWVKPTATNKTGEVRREYTGGEGRTLQLDLLFDGYESGGVDVVKRIKGLERLSTVRKTDGKDDERRPHHCVVAWGDRGLPSFPCVIETLDVKYQLFSTDGKPLRAIATVKLQEADTVTIAKSGT